jgi:uncharacterized membrane protein YccC
MPVEPTITDSQIDPAVIPAVNTPKRWRLFWQTVTHFDRSKLLPRVALRNSVGVAIPLAIGVLTGHALSGVAIATGALNVSYSDAEDSYPRRARRMLLAAVLTSGAVFLGGILGRDHAIAIFVAALWAFGSGLVVSLGTTAADLGVISLVTLVVFSAQGLSAHNAAWAGLLALSGSLFQTVLSLLFWPVQRYEPERRALAQLYLELARIATTVGSADGALGASQVTTQAQEMLSTLGQDHGIEGERYRSLLNQAERIRLCLVILARLHRRLGRENPDSSACPLLHRYLEIAGDILYSIGVSLDDGAQLNEARNDLVTLARHTESFRELPRAPQSPFLRAILEDSQLQMDALGGQLRAAVDLADHATPAGQLAFEQREAAKPKALRIASAVAVLRANLTLKSAACRHALRLSACVAVGGVLSRELDWRRSYWLPMTVAIVLKPDFTSTFSRGVLRLTGTFAGLGIATLLFHFVHPSTLTQVALVGLFTYGLRFLGPANYGVFVICISALIVLLVGLTGISPAEVIPARALNTAVGGLLALLAYWIWPTWERTQVRETLALMLDAYRAYFRAILETYQQPASDPSRLNTVRLAARLARSNVEASIDRLSGEPGADPKQVSILTAMLATSHRVLHVLMALEAGLKSSFVPAREAIKPFARDIDLMFYYFSAALRGSPYSRKHLPDLREDHRQLLLSGDPHTERHALVNVETDRLTNSLNTLEMQVSELLGIRR